MKSRYLLIVIILITFPSLAGDSGKKMNLLFLDVKLPFCFKQAQNKKFNYPNSKFFRVENKKVVLLSFLGEKDYFEYPTICTIFFKKNLTQREIELFCKKLFFNSMLNEHQKNDFPNPRWEDPEIKTSKRGKNKIETIMYSGNAFHPTIKPLMFSVSLSYISTRYGTIAFVTGYLIDTQNIYSKDKIQNIVYGYKNHLNTIMNILKNSRVRQPVESKNIENMLIKKGKFRYLYSSSLYSTTGNLSVSSSSGKMLFIDFFSDHTLSFKENYTNLGTTQYKGSNIVRGYESQNNNKNNNKRVKFYVFRGYYTNKYWLVIENPTLFSSYRVLPLKPNCKKMVYVTVKTGNGYKNKRMILKGLSIDNKCEGFFSRMGSIIVYKKPALSK